MRAWEVAEGFGRDKLRLVERPEPAPAAGELLLRLRAASLNYRDLLMVEGRYNPKQPLPLVPCSDAVGEVIALGAGVRGFALGDRVCPIFAPRWLAGEPDRERLRTTLGGPLDGTLRQTMTIAAESVVRPPAHLSDDEAAALPCAAVTAWSALVEQGRLRAGETVLVLGTGGVALFALQIALLHGARVLVTSSSDAKLERVRAMGAWETINYSREKAWGKRVRELSGDGVDHVVEVGGAGTLPESLRAVRMGGTVHLIGVLAGGEASLLLAPIFMQQVRVQGVLVGPKSSFEALDRALALHADRPETRPVVDRTFAFEDAPAAFDHMAAGAHFGKICVAIA
ncbi:MAG TPA: NAD(P)-dependent alcohol dehydrogenase [Thermoanaerobaculia bacterium]|nr:NAD(P)-dependent alcohol dehydrogenase [Thermoanaerobaculia bacterium]